MVLNTIFNSYKTTMKKWNFLANDEVKSVLVLMSEVMLWKDIDIQFIKMRDAYDIILNNYIDSKDYDITDEGLLILK